MSEPSDNKDAIAVFKEQFPSIYKVIQNWPVTYLPILFDTVNSGLITVNSMLNMTPLALVEGEERRSLISSLLYALAEDITKLPEDKFV